MRLRTGVLGACVLSLVLPALAAPAASGHGTSAGPLGPQGVDGPAGVVVDAATQARCDPIDPHACLLPFPNDLYTRPDPTTDTGRRLDLNLLSMPRNTAGKPIDPAEWNRNDGFSPGQLVVAMVPGLDVRHTALPPITDPTFATEARSAVIAIDTVTRRRHVLWAELDHSDTGRVGGGTFEGNAVPGTPPLYDVAKTRALLVRPAVNWTEGHRYIVVLQNMKDATGARIASSPVFAAYRDKTPTPMGMFEDRRPHFDRLFSEITRARGPKIHRSEIYLAWDFTVASARNLSERMLAMRDDAFAALGNAPPPFRVTSVQERPEKDVFRRVQGTFDVPRYVSTTQPGASMVYRPGSTIPARQSGDQQATFTCNIPSSAVGPAGVRPSGVSLYGHGLLGSQDEVNSDAEVGFGVLHNWTFCATNWLGMSTDDLPVVVGIITDLSNFHIIADRSQQGMLNFLFLGRLLRDPRAFAAHPAFRLDDRPLIDPATLVYYGNSQGGIMGGALTAVATDFTRAVLGVPAMNYSTLLTRSSDFDSFATIMYPNYPDGLDRNVIFSLMQTLWDRGESNGYAHHMTTKPYPRTPAHRVLLHAGFGDHQVTNYAVEVEAATIGAAAHVPASPRHWGRPSFAWFKTISASHYPYAGSALMEWDSGVPAPPLVNLPNRAAKDPHETPRRDPRARKQMDHFFRTGTVIDVCTRSGTDGSCQTVKRDGPLK